MTIETTEAPASNDRFSVCRFGIARGDITPPVGIYHRMWGAAAHEQAAGVHRPLTATVAVFQSAAESAGLDGSQWLVALDHCVFRREELVPLAAAICEATGIEESQITFVCSHTHAAGLMMLTRVERPGGDMIPGYLESVRKTLGELAEAARRELQPVTITYARGRCHLAAHRNAWDTARQQWVCGYHPAGPADDTVLVGRVTDEAGQVIATVVNYACHPTTLGWENKLISPDYPGAMREVVEAATGAPCLFLQGAAGDLGPKEGFVGDPAVADRNGKQLGYAALAALHGAPPPRTRYVYEGPVVSGATLGIWNHRPLEGERLDALADWSVRHWEMRLPYRPELPDRRDVAAQRDEWLVEEQQATDAQDTARARERHALVERANRRLTTLESLPDGDAYPYQIGVWRIGEAIWVAVQGEPYQQLQQALRAAFPEHAVVVMTIAGPWGASYLPPAESYGQGIYQETIAVVAAGSLERLCDELVQQIQVLLARTN